MSVWKKKDQGHPKKKAPRTKPKPYIPPEIPKTKWSKPNSVSDMLQGRGYSGKEQAEIALGSKNDSQIKVNAPKIDSEKEFLKIFKDLTYRHRAWDVWNDFVVMAACALSNPVDKTHFEEREKRYLSVISKYEKEEQKLFPTLFAHVVMALELNPEQDFLGKLYMMLDLGDEGRQQIFTPYHVCQLMADISMHRVVEQVQKNGFITIDDPCCGAGATLIAGVYSAKRQLEKANLNYQNHILVSGQDIDETVALMCYIQLSLLGIAAYIKIGNSITEPMSSNDTIENYWFTPMYFSKVWAMRRLFMSLDKIFRAGDDAE